MSLFDVLFGGFGELVAEGIGDEAVVAVDNGERAEVFGVVSGAQDLVEDGFLLWEEGKPCFMKTRDKVVLAWKRTRGKSEEARAVFETATTELVEYYLDRINIHFLHRGSSLRSSSDSKRNTNCLVLVLKLEKVLDVPICVVESVDKDWPLKSLLLTTTFTAGVGLVPVSV